MSAVTPGTDTEYGPVGFDDGYELGRAVGYDEAFAHIHLWLEAEHPELIDELSEHVPLYVDDGEPMALMHEVPC